MNPVQRPARILKILDVSSVAILLSTPNDFYTMFHEDKIWIGKSLQAVIRYQEACILRDGSAHNILF